MSHHDDLEEHVAASHEIQGLRVENERLRALVERLTDVLHGRAEKIVELDREVRELREAAEFTAMRKRVMDQTSESLAYLAKVGD